MYQNESDIQEARINGRVLLEMSLRRRFYGAWAFEDTMTTAKASGEYEVVSGGEAG